MPKSKKSIKIPQYKEYSNENIRYSWTNLLATAKSLAVDSPRDKSTLQLALKHVRLANEMIDKSDYCSSGFKVIIQKLEQEIRSALEKCNNKST